MTEGKTESIDETPSTSTSTSTSTPTSTSTSTSDSERDDVHDVVVIGGGPAGLSAAMYAARAALDTLVLDKNPAAGALGHASTIENYPGCEAVEGTDLLERFREQAAKFGATLVQAQAFGVDLSNPIKEVYAADTVYKGRAVIVATGAMGRKPSIEGEERLLGRGVSYCATCDAPFFREKPVAVLGKIDEVVHELDTITKFAKTVYLVTRSTDIGAEQQELLAKFPNVVLKSGYRTMAIDGDERVEEIELAAIPPREDGNETLEVDGVFVFLHANKPIVEFLYGALEVENGCIAIDHRDMSTSTAGVFACGDVTCKEVRQVVIATAEGCIAALSAEKFLSKRSRAKAQWN